MPERRADVKTPHPHYPHFSMTATPAIESILVPSLAHLDVPHTHTVSKHSHLIILLSRLYSFVYYNGFTITVGYLSYLQTEKDIDLCRFQSKYKRNAFVAYTRLP